MMKKHTQYTEQGEMVMKELRRFQRVYRLHIMCDFFNGGVVLTILLLLSAMLYKTTYGSLHISLWIFAAIPFCAAFLSLLTPLKITGFASTIDRKLGLEERLITSIHFLGNKEAYAVLLFNDTLNRMKTFEPGLLFPMKWHRAIILLFLLGGLLSFSHFHKVTGAGSSGIPHISQDVQMVMQREGAQLTQLADTLERNPSFTEPWEKHLIQKLEDFGEKLQFESPGKQDTLLMLSDLSSSIKSHYKEKTVSNNTSDSDDAHSTPLEESPIPSKEDAVKEVLNSLRLAKSHIAEAELEGNRERTGHELSKSGTKGPSRGKSISGASGESGHPDATGNSSAPGKTLSRGGNIAGRNNNTGLAENLAFPPEGIILKYADSIIPLESVPGKYHRIIIKYFDAVSGGHPLQESEEGKD